MSAGSSVGRSPCTIDDDRRAAVRIELAERLENAVGAGGMVGAGHHRASAGLVHHRFDLRRIGRHHHRADGGGFGAPQHMHDHRLAGDVGERFARQAGRGHAGGNDNKNVSHRSSEPSSPGSPALARLYGLQDARQTGYFCVALLCRCGAIQR